MNGYNKSSLPSDDKDSNDDDDDDDEEDTDSDISLSRWTQHDWHCQKRPIFNAGNQQQQIEPFFILPENDYAMRYDGRVV